MSLSKHPSIIASQGVLVNTTIPYIWDLSNTRSIISTTDVMDMYTDCISHDIVNFGSQAFGLSTEYTEDIDTYFISPPYELSSGVSNDYYSSSFSDLQDITFDKTGLVCMLVGHDGASASNYIVYDVSPPFDFQNGSTLRVSNSEGPSRVISIEIAPDGDKVIGLTEDGTSIISWNMYTFDVTTMYNYQINTLFTDINDITINQNGTQMVAISDGVCSFYTFGTPYDIQTLTFVRDIPIPAYGYGKTITVRNDGTTIQIGDYTDVRTFNVSYIDGWQILDISEYAETGATLTTVANTLSSYMHSDGTRMWIYSNGSGGQIIKYNLSIPFDLSTAVEDYGSAVGNANTFYWSDDGTNIYIASNTTITQYSVTTPFELSDGFTNVGSIPLTTSRLLGIVLSPDGTTLIGSTYNVNPIVLVQYVLSTPWDITTMGDEIQYTNANLQTSHCIAINQIGNQLIVNGSSTNPGAQIYEMSTPWDITTITVGSNVLDVGAYGDSIMVSTDGMKLYLGDYTANAIKEYYYGL